MIVSRAWIRCAGKAQLVRYVTSEDTGYVLDTNLSSVGAAAQSRELTRLNALWSAEPPIFAHLALRLDRPDLRLDDAQWVGAWHYARQRMALHGTPYTAARHVRHELDHMHAAVLLRTAGGGAVPSLRLPTRLHHVAIELNGMLGLSGHMHPSFGPLYAIGCAQRAQPELGEALRRVAGPAPSALRRGRLVEGSRVAPAEDYRLWSGYRLRRALWRGRWMDRWEWLRWLTELEIWMQRLDQTGVQRINFKGRSRLPDLLPLLVGPNAPPDPLREIIADVATKLQRPGGPQSWLDARRAASMEVTMAEAWATPPSTSTPAQPPSPLDTQDSGGSLQHDLLDVPSEQPGHQDPELQYSWHPEDEEAEEPALEDREQDHERPRQR